MNPFRVLRWSAPALVAGAVAIAASGVLTADADPPLPARTAAQLLADVQNAADVAGLSGTIVQKSDLGLPELPTTGPNHAGISLASLLTGKHTLRVWYAGPDKQRLALLGTLGEVDLIHNARDVWQWTSETNTAVHSRLPASAVYGDRRPTTTELGLTPQQAAELALKAIDPSTAVTTDGTASVAGRAAYELVLSPRDTRSLIGQVRLAVDAQTHVPLRVQVFSRNSGAGAAVEIGFTRISFAVPGDEQFRFTPPPGATVRESTMDWDRAGPTLPKSPQRAPGAGADRSGRPGAGGATATGNGPRLVGHGWTTVAVFSNVTAPSRSTADGGSLAGLLDRLPRVSGSWGSGRLLTSRAFSALLTDDGRLLVGAVAPELLYQAAGQR